MELNLWIEFIQKCITMEYKIMVKESFSLRLLEETKNKLELISIDTGRTNSFIAIEAINNYCDMQAWQISAIQEGIKKQMKVNL